MSLKKKSVKKIAIFSVVGILVLFLIVSVSRSLNSNGTSINSGIDIGNSISSDFRGEESLEPELFAENEVSSGSLSEDSVASSEPFSGESSGAGPLPTQERAIIQTGTLYMLDESPESTMQQIRRIAETAGGFVSSSALLKDSEFGDYVEGRIEIRVPSETFLDTTDRIAALGDEIIRKNIDSTDATLEIIDLNARIDFAEKSIERLSMLLLEAEDLDQIFYLEGQLASRQADLDSTKSRLTYLSEQVAFSTLTTSIQNEKNPSIIIPEPVVEEPEGFASGLEEGWEETKRILTTVATDLGFFLPLLIFVIAPLFVVIGVVALVFYVILRRITRNNVTVKPQMKTQETEDSTDSVS